jgi:flagellar hook-associated protein FlgK
MPRSQLIEQKQQVIAQLQRARRELERLRGQTDPRSQQRVRELEAHMDRLMAEEHRLRLAIDRAHD